VEWLAEEKTVVITSKDHAEDLKGFYRVEGRFYPEALPMGKFTIHFAENFDHNLTSTELVKFDEPRYVFASLSLEQSMQAILA
jgi:hypothetical protein